VQVTGPLTDDELTGFLAERLARYKTPRTFEFTTTRSRDAARSAAALRRRP
jgi:hypothetical protein